VLSVWHEVAIGFPYAQETRLKLPSLSNASELENPLRREGIGIEGVTNLQMD
jgi:hypothetical protein